MKGMINDPYGMIKLELEFRFMVQIYWFRDLFGNNSRISKLDSPDS